MDEPEQVDAELARARELIHARYLGTTPVVMPDLDTRERCCEAHNQIERDEEGEPKAHTVLEHGHVILLDRHSAEGREDFEVVDSHTGDVLSDVTDVLQADVVAPVQEQRTKSKGRKATEGDSTDAEAQA
jgi:hypothetical protein